MNELEGCADLDPDHCPFCGSDEVDPDGWKDGQGRTGPSCDNCGATAESVEEWNHRPIESQLRKRVTELEGAFQEITEMTDSTEDAAANMWSIAMTTLAAGRE